MENSQVKFRRGHPYSWLSQKLPTDITDGYITIDMNTGNMYLDSNYGEYMGNRRKIIGGKVFCMQDVNMGLMEAEVDGVPDAFNGLSVTFVVSGDIFDDPKTMNTPLKLALYSETEGTQWPETPIYSDWNRPVCLCDILSGVPYTVVYYNSAFHLENGSLYDRLRWGYLNDYEPVPPR